MSSHDDTKAMTRNAAKGVEWGRQTLGVIALKSHDAINQRAAMPPAQRRQALAAELHGGRQAGIVTAGVCATMMPFAAASMPLFLAHEACMLRQLCWFAYFMPQTGNTHPVA